MNKHSTTTNLSALRNSGFGILEALIASAIIVVFAAGVVVLGKISLRNVVINKHKLQAAYLAQEAVEALRNIRDTNWVDNDPNTNWDNGLPTGEKQGIFLKTTGSVKKWEVKSNVDQFNLNNTVFTREIRIRRYPAINSLDQKTIGVQVIVSWNDYGKERNVTINSYITDWMSY